MKKTLVTLMVLALAASLAGPAAAKKKGPKPYKSEEVTIQVGHSVQYNNSCNAECTAVGVTPQEFIRSCAIPSSNGFDAYVWEVPAAYKNVNASLTAFGSGGSAGYDLDVFLFDDACEITMVSQSTSVDETTIMAPGTAYILIYNFGSPSSPVGGGDSATARFELKPYVAPKF